MLCLDLTAIFSSRDSPLLKIGFVNHKNREELRQNKVRCDFCRYLYRHTPPTARGDQWMLGLPDWLTLLAQDRLGQRPPTPSSLDDMARSWSSIEDQTPLEFSDDDVEGSVTESIAAPVPATESSPFSQDYLIPTDDGGEVADIDDADHDDNEANDSNDEYSSWPPTYTHQLHDRDEPFWNAERLSVLMAQDYLQDGAHPYKGHFVIHIRAYLASEKPMAFAVMTREDAAAAYVPKISPITDFNAPHAFSQAKELLNTCLHECPSMCNICGRSTCVLQCICHQDDSACKICKHQDRSPCALFHQNCHMDRANLPHEDPPLPNRVLDVGCRVNETVRLFERDLSLNAHGSTTNAPYVALSYCWGVKEQRCQTSASNVDDFRVSIPWERLELSIQHAIQCTRSLGYRYLWVDCLCIIQDNERDKKACIALLKEIFQNATVTLVAEATSSVRNGFLKSDIDIEQFDFPFYIKEQLCSTITLIPLADQDDSQRIGTRARAWCLEEFLLSPRKLIYSKEDIRWRCLTTECRPLGSGHIQHANELDQFPREVWDPVNEKYFRSFENRSRMWMKYVDEYASRQLTQPQDGARAIAGLGHRLARAFGDTYVQDWGIFENALECGFLLSWLVQSPQAKRFPHVPSWSWLSVKHESRVSFLKPVVFNTRFRVVFDSSRPGVLNVYAVVIKLWKLSRRERDQIVFHRDSQDSISQKCFLLMFDYGYGSAYSGLVIRRFQHKQYGRCWQRIALFEQRLSDSHDDASRSPELSQGPALSPPDSDDDQNEYLDDAQRDEERERYDRRQNHSRSSQEMPRPPGISHLFREIKLI